MERRAQPDRRSSNSERVSTPVPVCTRASTGTAQRVPSPVAVAIGESLLRRRMPARRRQDREAGLEDPRVHDLADGFAGRVFERVPQVGRLGVRESVAVEIVAHAGAERIGAEPAFEHAQHRPALLVGEDVEHAVGVFGRDAPRTRRCGCWRARRRRARPARPSAKSSHVFHSGLYASTPRCSMNVANASFSQMPFHHFMVTRSPNHMCAISCTIVSAASDISSSVTCFGIEQQSRLAERHAAEVLHRAEREVGERDEVALLARIRDAVVVGEVTGSRTCRRRARTG